MAGSQSTYGFKDLAVTLTHPAMGQFSFQGEGLGSITFTFAEDASSHNLAADGSVMTSKVEARNGSVAISAQQTSDAHAWLTRLFNYLQAAPAREWAQMELMAHGSDMRVTHEASNMSFQKRPDKPYQQQGQQVVWTLLAGDMEEH